MVHIFIFSHVLQMPFLLMSESKALLFDKLFPDQGWQCSNDTERTRVERVIGMPFCSNYLALGIIVRTAVGES